MSLRRPETSFPWDRSQPAQNTVFNLDYEPKPTSHKSSCNTKWVNPPHLVLPTRKLCLCSPSLFPFKWLKLSMSATGVLCQHPVAHYVSLRASTLIPSRESDVNSNGSLEFTSRTVAETRGFTRLGGEVKDSGFQETRTGPTASVSMWTTGSVRCQPTI
ncbi:hypothetical protein LROSL3_1142 [Furfurilactobacillus rossiae]|jgi:hypothetical protein|nr:hypothetical protein LROSL2_1141 [Furfurilactobacillus rossiae]QLE68921.1 hypothetical protein LROSL3_1142 [Furfurilactobacillus rossiae]